MQFTRMLVLMLYMVCILANLLAALPAAAQLVQVPNVSEFGNSANQQPFFA
jgi:hypothetical protein